MATPKKPVEPLTPAEVAAVAQLVEDRHAALLEAVTAQIAAALVPVDDAIAALDARITTEAEASVKYGAAVGLRMAAGQVLCADLGGPSVPEQSVSFSSRENVAAHESFKVERGQG